MLHEYINPVPVLPLADRLAEIAIPVGVMFALAAGLGKLARDAALQPGWHRRKELRAHHDAHQELEFWAQASRPEQAPQKLPAWMAMRR